LHLDRPILRAKTDQFHLRDVRDQRSLSHRPGAAIPPELSPTYASPLPTGKNRQNLRMNPYNSENQIYCPKNKLSRLPA
jgi:hypothetical protein